MKIRQQLMSDVVMKKKAPYIMKPEFIIIHNTANDASAANEITYMNRDNDNIVSFHYAVDDVEIVQGLPLNRNSWNAGDGAQGKGNRKGIAIEICYSKSGGPKFIAAEKNAAKLTAQLLTNYGWGINKVTKHQDYSGKYCPHRTLDMGWTRFLNMVQAELNALQKKDYIGNTVKRDTTKAQVEVLVEQLVVRDKPNLLGTRLGYAKVGYYNSITKSKADGYTWYKLGNMYAPDNGKWIKEHKAEKPIEKPTVESTEDERLEEPKPEPETQIPDFLCMLINFIRNLFRKER